MQKRIVVAWINNAALRRCITKGLSLILCFVVAVLMVAVPPQASASSFGIEYSPVFLSAADTTSGANFAETYGLELADGEKKKVTFEVSNYSFAVVVKKGDSIEDVAVKLNMMLQNVDHVASYDKVSGQLIVTDQDSNKTDLKMYADGIELTMKLPLQGSGGIPEVLDMLDTVISLVNCVWTLMTSNPLLVLFLAVGLLILGVRMFRQIKSAAQGRKG